MSATRPPPNSKDGGNNMERIKFKSKKMGRVVMSFLIGKQNIRFMPDDTFGVANGTAKRLRNGHGVKVKVIKWKGDSE